MATIIGSKPLGQRVDIGGYCLHAQARGAGQPAIVMDTGLGFPGLLWEAVARETATFAQTIVIDRAGYGWSDSAPATAPRTTTQIVAETRAVLQGLGVPPPYILAGHSFGGLNMHSYAQTYPAEVAGLALVDSSHPEQIKRMPSYASAKSLIQGLQMSVPLARWGLFRWFDGALLKASFAGLDVIAPEARAAFLAFAATPDNYLNALREAELLEASVAQLRHAPGLLGALPLEVLTAGHWTSGGLMAAGNRTWLALQREHAALSSRGVHTIVPNCNHASIITLGRAAVVAALRRLVDDVRKTN